jgi:flagellar protein FlgJ
MSAGAVGDVVNGLPATSQVRPPSTEDEKKLRKAAGELEGMFVAQLFKAMRDTVPQQDGIVSGGSGEDIFTGLLDEHLAAETPKHWSGGISEALYRQLRHGLPPASSTATDATSATVQAVVSTAPSSSDPLAR